VAVVDKLIDISRDLESSPYAGRMVPEFEDKSIREHIIYSYRLIYRIKGKVVTIAAVIHGKRSLDTLIEEIKSRK